jgi:hypothetical protein
MNKDRSYFKKHSLTPPYLFEDCYGGTDVNSVLINSQYKRRGGSQEWWASRSSQLQGSGVGGQPGQS